MNDDVDKQDLVEPVDRPLDLDTQLKQRRKPGLRENKRLTADVDNYFPVNL